MTGGHLEAGQVGDVRYLGRCGLKISGYVGVGAIPPASIHHNRRSRVEVVCVVGSKA